MISQETKTTEGCYSQTELHIDSGGRDVVVISDLHVASGINANGNYDGTENFFADESFQRFIQYISTQQQSKKAILVINGDFIDFLRIRDYPETTTQILKWQQISASVGINKSVEELKQSISKKETQFGLKTNDYKTIWKLHVCVTGHLVLFKQLADWVASGNTLVIVKGNHDLEWYWPAVRSYFNVMLREHTQSAINFSDQNLLFVDDALVIDEEIFIEHGHKWENITAVKGEPTVNNSTELNLPFGSFINRYLINRLELAYPFLDNVRPTKNVLAVLLKERFPLALKVIACYIPFMLRMIPKGMYWQTFKYLLEVIVVIVLPVAITAYAIYTSTKGMSDGGGETSFIGRQLLTVGKNLGFLFLSYIFGRLMAMAQLSAPPSHLPMAKEVFKNSPAMRLVTYGHSHNSEQAIVDGKFYFNTGTWMPVFDISIGDVRIEKTYTYLLIQNDEPGNLKPQLLRWNDDAGRPELMVLQDKK